MLKKIILFFVIFGMGICYVNADESKMFYLDDPIPGVYTLMDKVYKKAANYVKVIRRKSDNAFVYCVSPGVAIDSSGVYNDYHNNQWAHLNVSEEKWQKINLIAYYGYGFGNHHDLTWYAVTQYLIWLEVLPEGWDVYFTDKLRGERTNKFDNAINELRNLVESYYINPSIDANIKLNYGNSLDLVDYNNVIDGYQLFGNDKVTKNGNSISISNVTDNFSFKLKLKTSGVNSILYMYPNAQSVISRGDLPNKEFTYNVNVEKGKIKVIKKRDETVYLDFFSDKMSLKNAKYSIYNDNYYAEFQTNESGEIITGDLPVGKYYIKELEPSYGYELDSTIYEINLNNNETKKLVIREKTVALNLDITKYYRKEDVLSEEEGALFAIYDLTNNLLVQKVSDCDGKISFNLPAGEYLLKQLSGEKGYYLAQDEIIKVSNSDTIKKDIVNEPILTEVEIYKVDEENKLITDQNFSFKIYDKTNNSYLIYDESNEFNFIDGNIVLPLRLPYGDYIIEEIENDTRYYDTNTILEFKIDNTNHEKLKLSLSNKVKKYSLKVFKEKEINKNEKVIIVPADNIEFCLFAKNDVIINKKNIYLKDSLVSCQKTNEEGIVVFNDLVYGEYYLNENINDEKYEKPDSIIIELDTKEKNIKIVNYLKPIEEEIKPEKIEKPTLDIPKDDIILETIPIIGSDVVGNEIIIGDETEQNFDSYIDNPKTKDNILKYIFTFTSSLLFIFIFAILGLKSNKNADFSKKNK